MKRYQQKLEMDAVLAITSREEQISPYKFTVMIFLKALCELKEVFRMDEDRNGASCLVLTAPQRKAYAMLSFKLIHGQDVDIQEFQAIIRNHTKSLSILQLDMFRDYLSEVYKKGIASLEDMIEGMAEYFKIGTYYLAPVVTESSIIGVFIVEIMELYKKQSFEQCATSYKGLQQYLEVWFQSSESHKDTSKIHWSSTDSGEETTTSSSPDSSSVGTSEESSSHSTDISLKENNYQPQYWTKKQTENFIAQQAKYLLKNEGQALTPKKLQDKISEMLRFNPANGRAHYLTYLNCVRAREFCGAIDSLCKSFDENWPRSGPKELTSTENSHGSCFAALNMSMLHINFGHTNEALLALKESIMLAHQSNNNICLQNALAWLYSLSNKNKELLMESSIAKSEHFKLYYVMAHGLQSLSHYRAINKAEPSAVFELLSSSDEIAWEYSLTDLICKNYSLKATLWSMYGKTDMMFHTSQILLNMNTENVLGEQEYYGESFCEAACNTANYLMARGEYKEALLALQHVKIRFPHEPVSRTWLLCEHVITFKHMVYQGKLQEAANVVEGMYALNIWESLLSQAELKIALQDYTSATMCITHILQREVSPSEVLSPTIGLRAHIMAAEILSYSSAPVLTSATAVEGFLRSLNLAQVYHLNYFVAIIGLQVANLQLHLGLPEKALELVECHLLTILTHGSIYDQARALMLSVKCRLAVSAGSSEKVRKRVLESVADTMNKVYNHFLKAEAYSRAKDAAYLQALIYNEMKNIVERNRCSLNFRTLDEQHPASTSPAVQL